jgi:hypothetical protein
MECNKYVMLYYGKHIYQWEPPSDIFGITKTGLMFLNPASYVVIIRGWAELMSLIASYPAIGPSFKVRSGGGIFLCVL